MNNIDWTDTGPDTRHEDTIQRKAEKNAEFMCADIDWVLEGIENSNLKSIAELLIDFNKAGHTADVKREIALAITLRLDIMVDAYFESRAIELAEQGQEP